MHLTILARTPRVLRALLGGLGDEWVHAAPEGAFSAFDVVGHLIVGERTDWLPRLRIILEHGPSRPFDAYDRYAQFEASRGKSMEQLLDEFEMLRSAGLDSLRAMNLGEAELSLRGRHPALGEVSLGNLLATWAAHDLNHLAQIAGCLARRFDGAVGPWKQYLTILTREPTRMSPEGATRKLGSHAAAEPSNPSVGDGAPRSEGR